MIHILLRSSLDLYLCMFFCFCLSCSRFLDHRFRECYWIEFWCEKSKSDVTIRCFVNLITTMFLFFLIRSVLAVKFIVHWDIYNSIIYIAFCLIIHWLENSDSDLVCVSA